MDTKHNRDDGCMRGCGALFMLILWPPIIAFGIAALISMSDSPCLKKSELPPYQCVQVDPAATERDHHRWDALKPIDDAFTRGICLLDTAKDGRGNEANPECRW